MNSITIRLATASDIDILLLHDKHVSKNILEQAVELKHVMVIEEDGNFAGCLRWNLFWDSIPFLNMLFLLHPFRHRGLGRTFITAWEDFLRKEGYSQAMTSTQVNEEGQFFYRKLGYTDCGCLFPFDQSSMEIFLQKELNNCSC